MVTPQEAERVIQSHLRPLPVVDCPLLDAHYRVLREPIRADRAMPPFDRVTMDGFAIRAAAVAAGRQQFRVVGLQGAGMPPLTLTHDDACIEIATGATLPHGADAVVPYEETEGRVRSPRGTPPTFAPYDVTLAPEASASAGRNVHRRGSDHRAGEELVPAGTRLSGGEIAVAAACGVPQLRVTRPARVAIIATGDELVEVDASEVGAQQIRRSNDYALRAAVLRSGWTDHVERFHLRDDPREIDRELNRILGEFDVVLLTGGVSQGRFDYLPQALADAGVQQHLRGVAQRPGKPLWFGLSARSTPVFALPGNPVSCYTCLHRYVLPALATLAGVAPVSAEFVRLRESVAFPAPLAYFLPVVVRAEPDGTRTAGPVPFNTSGDLAGLVGTSGFVELPAAAAEFPAGTSVRYWAWA